MSVGVAPRRPPSAPAHTRRRRPPLRRSVGALLRLQLALELKTYEAVPGMTLFVTCAYVVFHFALNRGALAGDLAAGVLCVSLLLGALLAVSRAFVRELEQNTFDGLALTPLPGGALLLAKAGALLLYLVVLELVALPLYALLLLSTNLLPALGGVVVILLFLDLAIALVGTLIGGLVVRSRARDLLAPLLYLPLLIPPLIGAVSALSPLLAPHAPPLGTWFGSTGARWLTVLGLYDLIFGVIGYGLFDFLLED